MELREPPLSPQKSVPDAVVRWLLVSILTILVVLVTVVWLRPRDLGRNLALAEQRREVAAKLQAAGALDQAASLYEAYISAAEPPAATRARMAYSLGTNYLQSGQYEKALRWFYEAETLGGADLGDELSSRIVHCLERLGRRHSAQAALENRVNLEPDTVEKPENDPVVARIGRTEIRRSELDRALDDLPPELAGSFATPAGRQQLLEKYVADELLWRKAAKLEYDRDPEVARRHARALKQLAVARFVELEVLSKIDVDEQDLQNYFEANRERYARPQDEEGAKKQVSFAESRPQVERDYRLLKIQSAYDDLIESELATQDVELFPERLEDGR